MTTPAPLGPIGEQELAVRSIDPTAGAVVDTSARTVTTTTLTDEQLAYLRAELGPNTTAEEVQPRWERHGDVRLVALEVVRERLAALQAGPATFALAGVYSQSTAENLRSYREQVTRLVAEGAAGPGGGHELTRRRTRPVRGR